MNDDLISRRQAIEAIEGITSSMSICVNSDECHGMKRMQRQAVLEIANMPSAQPELDEWCYDCKEYDKEKHSCPRWNRVIRNTLKDAQPERKKAHWIDTGSGQECSACHEIQYGHDSFRFFCAYCGADMRGEQDDK